MLKVRMTAVSMYITDGWTCDGQWRFLTMMFPADELAVGRIDLGPFTVALDRADTITSWDHLLGRRSLCDDADPLARPERLAVAVPVSATRLIRHGDRATSTQT
ncbi:hypothetical protein AB0K00_50355 [Dactylosporangium sp. NPDC049525]|uniref:hypothetical protein n=1 Tax=Dactylosporangium sp. NPDC049525 TaxID=3154730 RepID=UPI003412D566